MAGKPKPRNPLSAEQRRQVERWIPMAVRLAGRSGPMQPADLDDARQEAFLQLCLSAQAHDSGRGTKYQSHAINSVRFRLLFAYQRRLANGFGGLKHLRSADIAQAVRPVASLDELPTPDALARDSAGPAWEEYERLHAALMRLDDREYAILLLGVVGRVTLQELADRLGLSKERVRQQIQAAVRKMRKWLGA